MEPPDDSGGGSETDGSESASADPTTVAEPNRVSGWDLSPTSVRARVSMTRLGIITDERAQHILVGDEYTGGHRWDARNASSLKFPVWWRDDRILGAIGDVALHPDEEPWPQDNGLWRLHGDRDEVTIRVILDFDGSVCTGHPLRGLGVLPDLR